MPSGPDSQNSETKQILNPQPKFTEELPESPLPVSRLCRNPSLSLRATEGSVPARRSVFFHQDASSSALRHAGVAISLFSTPYEIASVASLPRNDIAAQPPRGGEDEGQRGLFTKCLMPV